MVGSTIPDHHFTDIDIDNIEDEDGDDEESIPCPSSGRIRRMKPRHNDEDLEPSDDFGGSFPLSVEYDDDQPEPIDTDADDWF
jgi:hypothetical protein